MTGIIIATPPSVELPPSSNPNNPQNLPGVTYSYALLNLPQTWGAKQTFPPGDISLNAADITGLAPSATIDTTNASNITSGTIAAARLPPLAGGSTTQVQYNNAGALSGISGATTNGTTLTLTSPAITTPTGIVKGDVGLGNVDNTSDATKNAAAVILTNKTIDGANNTLTAPTAATGDSSTSLANTAFVTLAIMQLSARGI
jgi:hypothetical protein